MILDKVDRKIVRELQANGRLTNKELASRINLSPTPCLRRMRRLEKEGVIDGYAALINQEKYGLPITAFVGVRLERQSDQMIRDFEAGIQDVDEILECYIITGSRDYLLRVVAANLKQYERFIRETLSRLPGVTSIESSFAFGQVKRSSLFPLD